MSCEENTDLGPRTRILHNVEPNTKNLNPEKTCIGTSGLLFSFLLNLFLRFCEGFGGQINRTKTAQVKVEEATARLGTRLK